VAHIMLCVMSGYWDAVFTKQKTAPGAVVILAPALVGAIRHENNKFVILKGAWSLESALGELRKRKGEYGIKDVLIR